MLLRWIPPLRWALLLPLLWSLHAERALAANGPSAAATETELALCEFADISIADGSSAEGPGACRAADIGEAAPVAEAAPSDPAVRAAPMCDNAGASIVAVAEVPEVDRGRFEPAPCDVQRLIERLRSDNRAGSAALIAGGGSERPERHPIREQSERFDAACAGAPCWPLPAEPAIVALGAHGGLGWQPGHSARIDRPPCAP